MEIKGIDTPMFKPHSIRSATSSAAFNTRVALSDIVSDNLLKRYYESMYTALIQVKVDEAWRGTQLK